MNILYVVHTFSVIEPIGVLQLSAISKQQGHKSFIAAIEEGDVEAKVIAHDIDVVAYSFMSTETTAFRELSFRLRQLRPHLFIVAGGPHPTYYPKIVDLWPIDAVVVGEGDAVLPKILEGVENGKDFSYLPNVHTKAKKNPQGLLVADLDTLPYADRELVENVSPYKYVRMKTFFGTRGCPYKCAYCFNSAYNEMHKDKGAILRRRSVENLVTDIEQVVKKYPTDFIRFGDDTFVMQHDAWVDEFCEKYKKRVGLPFYFLIHPNLVLPGLIKALKGAGCHSVMVGIESGDPELRRKVLDRYVTNETMERAFRIFRDHDIKVFSNTILGLPETTLKDDLHSFNFSLNCHPTYLGFTVFTPFPGTALHKYSVQRGYVDETDFADKFPTSMQQGSCLKTITPRQKEIHENIIALAPLANYFRFLRKPIENHLIYWKPNIFFQFLAFLTRNYLIMQIFPFRKSPLIFIRLVLKVLKIDKQNYLFKSSPQGDAVGKNPLKEDLPPPKPLNENEEILEEVSRV